MDRYPAHHEGNPGADPTPAGIDPDVEVWEPVATERYPRVAARSGRGLRSRVVSSFPGAVAGTFLITALAFGAAFRPTADTSGGDGATGGSSGSAAQTGPSGDDAAGPLANGGSKDDRPTPTDKPAEEGKEASTDDEPKPEATVKPAEEPAPEPGVEAMTLALHLRDGYVKLSWSACAAHGLAAYKVVRSLDEKPTWPLGEGDELIAVADAGSVAAADGKPLAGKKVFYRVFAVDDAKVSLCQSPVRGLAVPADEPDPTTKPDPEPDPTDKPDGGDVQSIAIAVTLADGHPYVDWTECSGDFDYYKVVRSTDSKVTWPVGSGDSKVGAVGRDGKTKLWDGDSPTGKTLWYRVFCLRETDGGAKVVGASSTRGIEVPAAPKEPEPDPVALGFSVELDGEGVALNWEPCGSDDFVFYKVIRSKSSNPSYLPGTDGSEVIAVIENGGTTSFVDGDVAAGETWYYRVQAIGWMNEHKILLGQTAAKAITVE